jgi:plastocyanin
MHVHLRAVITTAVALVAVVGLPAGPASAGGGCHTRGTEGSGVTVELVNACMTPTVLRTAVGSTVTFVNRDSFAHNVNGHAFFENLPAEGDAATLRFTEAGIYAFSCSLHPGMTGAVVVGDAAAAAPAAPAPQLIAKASPRASGVPLPLAGAGGVFIAVAALLLGRRQRTTNL